MRGILRESNLDLLREVERLAQSLDAIQASLPSELSAYHTWARATCDDCRDRAGRHLQDLQLGLDQILPDVLSSTQDLTVSLALLNRRLLSPVLRAQPSDRLCLKLLQWLHETHGPTRAVPAGLSDGEFGTWPDPALPIIYCIPCSAQRGLLYLPLFFHEFGHLLYACHKPEMDDLVRALQEQIERLLASSVRGDARYAEAADVARQCIVEAWYEWAQELFCDAVAYTIGGPAFLEAFSMYLRLRGRDEYHLPREQLSRRSHPVTWLRARLLADRARRVGHDSDAQTLQGVWDTIAQTMGVMEDYYGFYEPEFIPAIRQTMDDMLTEASPRRFTERDANEGNWESPPASPIALLNEAWRRFRQDPVAYRAWEDSAVEAFLALETRSSDG